MARLESLVRVRSESEVGVLKDRAITIFDVIIVILLIILILYENR